MTDIYFDEEPYIDAIYENNEQEVDQGNYREEDDEDEDTGFVNYMRSNGSKNTSSNFTSTGIGIGSNTSTMSSKNIGSSSQSYQYFFPQLQDSNDEQGK